MPAITRPSWTRQPPVPTRVSAEWLAKGVVSVLVPFGESMYDVVQGRFLKRNSGGSAPNTVVPNGFGRASDFGASYWEVLGTNFGGTEYTVLTVVSDVPIAGSNYNFAAMDDTGSNRCFQNRINSSNQFQFIPFDTSGSTYAATSSVTLGAAENSKGWVQLVTVRNSQASIWKNGQKLASSTISGTPKGPSLNICLNARDASGTDVANASLNLVVIMKQGVTDGDAQRLSLNPWLVFQPPQPLFFVGPPVGGAYTLTADAGSYSLAGQDATLLKTRIISADAGAYVLAGQDATFSRGYTLTADAGSYVLAGQDATLTYAAAGSYTLVADAGSYSLGGQDATLLKTRIITGDAGAFTLSGQSATFSYSGAPVVSEPVRPQEGIDWGAWVRKSWGKEYGAPEDVYRFSNGRTFKE